MSGRPLPSPAQAQRTGARLSLRRTWPLLRRRVRVLRLLRRLVAALAGAAVASSCPYWPEDFRPACLILVKISEVFREGP